MDHPAIQSGSIDQGQRKRSSTPVIFIVLVPVGTECDPSTWKIYSLCNRCDRVYRQQKGQKQCMEKPIFHNRKLVCFSKLPDSGQEK
jgi:hypothetical protein